MRGWGKSEGVSESGEVGESEKSEGKESEGSWKSEGSQGLCPASKKGKKK